MPRLLATAAATGAYPPQLIRAAAILRMGAAELAHHLPQQRGLKIANLPPPPARDAPTIRDHLRAAAMHSPAPPGTRPLLQWLIECVEDDGFLSLPAHPTAFPAPAPAIDAAIAHLQSIAPAGVAARDAQERLLLILAQTPPHPARAAARRLVTDHWEALHRRRWDRLPKRGASAALQFIQSLPRPDLPTPPPPPSLPDVLFRQTRGVWRAHPAAGTAIQAGLDKNADAIPAELRAARETAAALRARRRWVLAAAQLAADHQSAFFRDGAAALRPFPCAAAAADLNISEAMLSHILHDKRAIFAGGEFPLKYLFGAHTGGAVLQSAIHHMIQNEDPHHPLSDEALRLGCRRRGLPAARRTIAKHRARAGIPPASLRKRAPSAP